MTPSPVLPHPVKIAVVGCGLVGSSFAYALLFSGLASEIVLVDKNRERAEGEAMDLNHAVPLTQPTKIRVGDLADTAGAAVTVIAAGVGQRPGETRLELNQRNAAVFREIVPQIAQHNPDGILLIATNPVDVLTYVAWKLSGLPPTRVIGSGTILDTARFRYLLSDHFGVDGRSMHAFIIGEHGDSEVPVWSLANIAGMPLAEFATAHNVPYDEQLRATIFTATRTAAYEIIRRKGATYYAVGAGLLRIVEAILRDQKTVLSVSSMIDGYLGVTGTALSLPAVVGRLGVERALQLRLDTTEEQLFRRSSSIVREAIEKTRLD